MSPPCSCAICGLPVTKGKEVLYHREGHHDDSGYAYVHDECSKRHEDYMRGMNMVKDEEKPVEWSGTKGGYNNG